MPPGPRPKKISSPKIYLAVNPWHLWISIGAAAMVSRAWLKIEKLLED
jgi:hypothetical protein